MIEMQDEWVHSTKTDVELIMLELEMEQSDIKGEQEREMRVGTLIPYSYNEAFSVW